ncbi:hypothetical protein [Cerasicoccus fimbriatus]|uniref:hypothetical protein n=1 Tax=Cerasicoccus fimbriatus TaxID=3014554 RepID=UPI0022B34A5C|nr:hypothetical protein [Cerasicoccus sp. TK19100]
MDIIFENIGTVNNPPYCVEFGYNCDSLTGGSGANVAKLILDHGWKHLLLDGGNENPAINLHQHFLYSHNICEIFRKYNVPQEPDYVSIDVDSTDMWLFDAVLKEFKPRALTVEYNSHFPLDRAITFPENSEEQWVGDRAFGASLKALNIVAQNHGYSLIWVIPCLDAFFVRNDLIDDGSGELTFPYEKWEHCCKLVNKKPLYDPKRTAIFLDYEVYLKTGGNEEAAHQAAQDVCNHVLLDTLPRKFLRRMRRHWMRLKQPKGYLLERI